MTPRAMGVTWLLAATLAVDPIQAFASLRPACPRRVLCLDGMWQIEQGSLESAPLSYTHTVVVPGLVDMAKPAFTEVGRKSLIRQAFWYRRTFELAGGVPDVAVLKIHKARYGAKVFLNGQSVGEHLPCSTPATFDLTPYLKGHGQENELVTRLGAHREALPLGMPTGWDFEKVLFIPGLYDSVELILTSAPHIVSVQTVPDVDDKTIRIVAEVIGTHGRPVRSLRDVKVLPR